jgi:hypothetical protein
LIADFKSKIENWRSEIVSGCLAQPLNSKPKIANIQLKILFAFPANPHYNTLNRGLFTFDLYLASLASVSPASYTEPYDT